MFELDCSISSTSPSALSVSCIGSRDIASVECIYDDGEIVEACEHVVFTRAYIPHKGEEGM